MMIRLILYDVSGSLVRLALNFEKIRIENLKRRSVKSVDFVTAHLDS